MTEHVRHSYTLGSPDRRIAGWFDRDYLGFTQNAAVCERWLATPIPSVTVILNLGAAFGGYPRSFVAGLTDRSGIVEQGGAIECVELKLTPLGAYRLLGTPMNELSHTMIDLDDLLPGARLLADRLAEEVGWSRRHLVAKFRQQVGLAPKTLARIVRFQHLVSRLKISGPVHWTRIAAECGYYDQAHMNRDFREFAGMTPTEFLARLVPAPEVTSVQYTWVSAA